MRAGTSRLAILGCVHIPEGTQASYAAGLAVQVQYLKFMEMLKPLQDYLNLV